MRQGLMSSTYATRMLMAGALALAIGLPAVSAQAQPTGRTYAPWEAAQTEAILDELREMVAAARRDRAASPDFLADLDGLIQRWEASAAPAPTGSGTQQPAPPTAIPAPSGTAPAPGAPPGDPFPRVVADTFVDGNYTANPAWAVLQGEWRVDEERRLRSDTRAAAGSTQIGFAAIELPQAIPNAFIMEWVVADLGQAGQIEARLFQTASRDPGYRLVLTGGLMPTLTLFRSSRSGVAQLDTTQIPSAQPGAPLHIVWSRNQAQVLTVWVNGEELMRVEDTVFREGWDGLLFGNFGGDFATDRIVISRF